MSEIADWYYADAARQPVGPMTQAALVEAARAGRLNATTPIWRTGWPAWRALSTCAAELGLVVVSAEANTPPQSKLGGCAIAAIILGGGIFALAVLGILAAIAIPAYQDYVLRAQVSAAIAEASAVKIAIAEQPPEDGACPENGAANVGSATSYASAVVASIQAGRQANGDCGLDIVLRSTNARLDAHHVYLTMPNGTQPGAPWRCTSDVDRRYLPILCR